ncbi:20-hydroxyecdysone protein [Glossina fuscipes]|uniref:20-hydroxyecdysone protein n=1 Tax=Glossina fuscipes TaxID=7396 RepID=A0A8U0W5Q2_9MUSC|nr:20-hydroxyecdysone protein [Glossina fuscipes]KAI9587812.1 hypothetical protein GQX74_003658 [Glossina fuscipes]
MAMRLLRNVSGILFLIVVSEAGLYLRQARNAQELLIPVAIITDSADTLDTQQNFVTVNEIIPEELGKFDQEKLKIENHASTTTETDKDIIRKEEQTSIANLESNENKALSLKQLSASSENVLNAEKEAESTQTSETVEPHKLLLENEENLDQTDSNKNTVTDSEGQGNLRQGTQAPPQQTTQANIVQQFIQNSPFGPFFNQLTGQNPSDASNNPVTSAPFNPLQSVVNGTTQAFQGFQQFASNLFGLNQNAEATSPRPGPIQTFVSNLIGGNNPPTQQQQLQQPQQQGPLQSILSVFQGGNNNRPPGNSNAPAIAANNASIDNREPEKQDPQITEQDNQEASADEEDNKLRDSAEVDDSFEELNKPNEVIIINDDNDARAIKKTQDYPTNK